MSSAQVNMEPKRKHNPAIIAGIVVIALLLAVYIAGVVVFSMRFYPNTKMGDYDLSLKSFDEVSSQLSAAESNFSLNISGQGFTQTLTKADCGIDIDVEKVMSSAKSGMNPALWFLNIGGDHDVTDSLTASANSNSLTQAVTTAVEEFNAKQIASTDAAIVYDSAAKAYKIQAEVNGGQLDANAVVQKAITAVLSIQSDVKLGDDVVIKPNIVSTDSRLTTGVEKANAIAACDITLVAQLASSSQTITEVNGDTISQWITFDENYSPVFDDDAMATWADELVSSLNTVGTTRTYTRGDGKSVTASGGDYGWAVDASTLATQLKDAINNGTKGEISVECSQTGNGYTTAGMDWGAYCDVDLTEQYARYYDASGNLLWESGIVSGDPTDGDSTPTGIYYLKMHQSPSMLRGPKKDDGTYQWESEVQYWMPFVGNLVGLHDANWQPSWAFDDATAYTSGYGSHGCVNLPTDKAASIYNIIQNGDPVIVHY